MRRYLLTILFWNIKGVAQGGKMLSPSDARYINLSKWLAEEVANSQFGVPVDIVVLAESPFHGQLTLPGMQPASTLLKPNSKTGCVLEVYHRNSQLSLDLAGGVGRAIVQKLTMLRTGSTMLLIAAHLESPERSDREEDRLEAVRDLTEEIEEVERQHGHKRTLLIGDLNYSPYDLPIYGAKYLHAVPTRELALERKRTVQGREHWFFYNPMWAHFAVSNAAAGTYYKRTSGVACRFWHMPDQVLIRPDLLLHWQDKLKILTRVGSQSVVNQGGVPNASLASDHLPLLLQLTI